MRPFHLVGNCLCVWAISMSSALCAGNPPGIVSVNPVTWNVRYRAFARVVPRVVVAVRVATTGRVEQLDVVPGSEVQAGETLARLGGADYTSQQRRTKAELAAAHRDLTITRQNYPHFSSAKDLADAQATFSKAQAEFDRVRAAGRIIAPCGGKVVSLDAADGDRLSAGQVVMRLLPAAQLWLRAAYYGAALDSVHAGMTGEFVPAGGGKPVPVSVVTTYAALAPDGAESVGLVGVTSSPGWRNGEYGNVVLKGEMRHGVAVPTRALVMNRGHWWVMLATSKGLRATRVVPGPTRGWQTFIRHGLVSGDRIAVDNAYLEFHRSIAGSYMPPD